MEEKFFEDFRVSPEYQKLAQNPVAYFCAEFAINEQLPTYAGGLGVLSGDYVYEAKTHDLPILAVGLYYYVGYKCSVSGPKKQGADLVIRNPQELGLKPVLDKNNQRVKVSVPCGERKIVLSGWVWDKETIPVYFLDANLEENNPEDRKISWYLYAMDKEIRIKQEMVLGIGGFRFLKAIGISPSIYHLNEGHSAFLSFELASEVMKRQSVDFLEAQELAKRKIVFTNHTLVAAGHDIFENEFFSLMLSAYANESGIAVSELLSSGAIGGVNSFSMTKLALSSAGKINVVSRLHFEYAAKLWPDFPIFPITNGIFIPRWDRVKNENQIWRNHQKNKNELLKFIYQRFGIQWLENELLIGWARRIVKYKRPLFLFEKIDEFLKVVQNAPRPVRVLYSGNPHPEDEDGLMMVEMLKKLSLGKLKNHLLYLDLYDTEVAKLMTSGCDLWLNTPLIGFEACGTSGMKAALNGVLPVSTDDGWMAEVSFDTIGWKIENVNSSDYLLRLLRETIIPTYYQQDASGIPISWVGKMVEARKLICEHFSTGRMLKDYILKLYFDTAL